MDIKAAVMVLVAAGVLAGCSGNPQAKPEIASLQTGGPASGKSSAAASSDDVEAKRPRERLDMTGEQVNALSDAWWACLNANGVTKQGWDEKGREVSKVCRHLEPLRPVEYDPKRPEAVEFLERKARCMRENGLPNAKVPAIDPAGEYVDVDSGVTSNDSNDVARVMDIGSQCEKKVLAG